MRTEKEIIIFANKIYQLPQLLPTLSTLGKSLQARMCPQLSPPPRRPPCLGWPAQRGAPDACCLGCPTHGHIPPGVWAERHQDDSRPMDEERRSHGAHPWFWEHGALSPGCSLQRGQQQQLSACQGCPRWTGSTRGPVCSTGTLRGDKEHKTPEGSLNVFIFNLRVNTRAI